MGLTKRQIDAASYEGNGSAWDLRYDDDVSGFAVRVYPSGAKSFVIRYRTKTGRTRLKTIGKYGVLTLDQARKRARKLLVDVADGGDPVEDERASKTLTVKAFKPIYLDRHAKPRKKTWKEDKRRIEKYVLPAIGSRALVDVKRSDVAALHSKIGQHAPVEANRVLALVSVMFTCAEKWGHVPEGSPNPAAGVEPFAEKSRERYVTPKELPSLVKAIEAEENVFVRAVLWLYLLTGCRKSELLAATWDNVDLERRELRIPETKAGRAHVVPLSAPAARILEDLPRFSDNPHVFPGARRGQPLTNISKNWRTIRESAGLEDVHLHDLRRTVGSWLAMSGASLPLIGKVLNHSNASTTQIYARLADELARNALDEYGEQVLKVAGRKPGQGDGT